MLASIAPLGVQAVAHAQEAPTASQGVKAPRLLSAPTPVYPPSRMAEGLHPTVMVEVVLSEQGQVTKAVVEHSAGPDFDAAALEAVRRWTFSPAMRDEKPVPSRIHVAVHFELPAFDLGVATPDVAARPRGSHPPVHTAPDPHKTSQRFSATAKVDQTELRTTQRSSSDITLERDVLEAAPRREGADLLRSVPGVYIARPEGDAVAHSIMLRGFDAEHGQDLEMRVGNVPLNLPSHIHGQGYSDLGFLIPEVVHKLHVTEGVYDPKQGDFAVAGSIDFNLGVEQRGVYLRSSYGSFDTFRQLALWAPEGESYETFGAVQYKRTDGFGQNRAGQSGSGMVQGVFGQGRWRYRALGIVYGAHADMAGVLRTDDVQNGSVGFYDVYPFATAQAQKALATRMITALSAEYRGKKGDNADMGLWFNLDNFQLFENFTGFAQRSRTLLNTSGRGDLIEQKNYTTSMGLQGRYRTAPYIPAAWAKGTLELGMTGRLDGIEQSQYLLDASVRNQIWDERVNANVRGLDIGAWGDLDWQFGPYLSVRGGLRADLLYYGIDDRLGNFAPAVRPDDTYIQGFHRSASGLAVGPRASAEARLLPWLSLLAAYGEGYRSPQARVLEDGESAPYTKVRSADLGTRLHWGKYAELSLMGFYTHLSDDVAFEASEGRLERIGETRRLGAVLHGLARPTRWLLTAASVTYVDAELLEPPPPSAEDPNPPYQSGQNLPYVPPLVLRIDAAADGVLLPHVAQSPLKGRIATGFSFLSSRPLPYGAFAEPVALLDASAMLVWRNLEAGFEVYNLLDSRYAAIEYNFTSQWNPQDVQSRLPARHMAAGAPRTLMATLGIHL